MSGWGKGPIKVVIVDDSAVVRQVFQRVLDRDPDVQVVGVAPDPFVARDLILAHKPDVVTLDLEMPRMDGLTFLRKIMAYSPVPTVVVSSLTPKGSSMAMEALKLGAVEVLHKPTAAFAAKDMVKSLVTAVKAAAMVRLDALTAPRGAASPSPIVGGEAALKTTSNKILAIGASTGGTQAVDAIVEIRSMPVLRLRQSHCRC